MLSLDVGLFGGGRRRRGFRRRLRRLRRLDHLRFRRFRTAAHGRRNLVDRHARNLIVQVHEMLPGLRHLRRVLAVARAPAFPAGV